MKKTCSQCGNMSKCIHKSMGHQVNERLEKEHIGWDAMVSKLKKEGHSQKSAEKIAGAINAKKNHLGTYKSEEAPSGDLSGLSLSERKKIEKALGPGEELPPAQKTPQSLLREREMEAAENKVHETNSNDVITTEPKEIAKLMMAKSEAELAKEDRDDKYNYYLVHKDKGTLHGGFEYKQDAQDAVEDYGSTGRDALTVRHRTKIDPSVKEEFHRHNKIMSKLHKSEDNEPGDAGYKPGDVIRISNDRHSDGHYHIRVISRDRHKERNLGFMYHSSDEHGNVGNDPYTNNPFHSNMLLSVKHEKVGHAPLEQKQAKAGDKTYTWHLTGNKKIDDRMAHHDERYNLFQDHASPRLRGTYSRNENENRHQRNGEIVHQFANHMAEHGKADNFKLKKAEESFEKHLSKFAQVEQSPGQSLNDLKKSQDRVNALVKKIESLQKALVKSGNKEVLQKALEKIDALKKSGDEGRHTYHIDHNERGEFRASVRNANGDTVYNVTNHEEDENGHEHYGEINEVRDGFMRHGKDISGLETHLKSLGILKPHHHIEHAGPND